MKVTLYILTILGAILVSQQSMAYREVESMIQCGELAPTRLHGNEWQEGGTDWMYLYYWPKYCQDGRWENIAYDVYDGVAFDPQRENITFEHAVYAMTVYCRHSIVGHIYADLYLVTKTSRNRDKWTRVGTASGNCHIDVGEDEPAIQFRKILVPPNVASDPGIRELNAVLSDRNRPNKARMVARVGKHFFSFGSGQVRFSMGFMHFFATAYGDSNAVPTASWTGGITPPGSDSGSDIDQALQDLHNDGGLRRHRRLQGMPRTVDPFRTRRR